MFKRRQELIEALNQSDIGWWVNTDTEARLDEVLREADAIAIELDKRFPAQSKAFGSIADRMIDDREAMKPFIQTMASPMTTPIRAMVFAVLNGATVHGLQVDYRYRQQASLGVVLRFPSGEESRFDTSDLWDFEVLRHFGLMKISDRPVIDGYYAFRKEA